MFYENKISNNSDFTENVKKINLLLKLIIYPFLTLINSF